MAKVFNNTVGEGRVNRHGLVTFTELDQAFGPASKDLIEIFKKGSPEGFDNFIETVEEKLEDAGLLWKTFLEKIYLEQKLLGLFQHGNPNYISIHGKLMAVQNDGGKVFLFKLLVVLGRRFTEDFYETIACKEYTVERLMTEEEAEAFMVEEPQEPQKSNDEMTKISDGSIMKKSMNV